MMRELTGECLNSTFIICDNILLALADRSVATVYIPHLHFSSPLMLHQLQIAIRYFDSYTYCALQ